MFQRTSRALDKWSNGWTGFKGFVLFILTAVLFLLIVSIVTVLLSGMWPLFSWLSDIVK
jgi:hypothetical protein